MKKHPLYYFSPCILVALLTLIIIVIRFQALLYFINMKFYAPMIELFSAVLILVAIDWPVKKFTKGNIIYLWIIEAILITVGLYFFPDLRVTLLTFGR